MTDQEAFEAFVSNYARTTKGERDITEEAWYAALTYLRSQQEPVAVIRVKSGYWIDTPQSATANLADGLHHLYAVPQPAIPDGWKLVPVEPTNKQEEVGKQVGEFRTGEDANEVYRAMLAAAPEPSK